MENVGYIYEIFCTAEKKYYIGQTINNVEDRWKQHVVSAKSMKTGSLLHQAIREHGEESFRLKKICKCPVEELNEREKKYIEDYNCMAPDGYNMTKGGGQNRGQDPEAALIWLTSDIHEIIVARQKDLIAEIMEFVSETECLEHAKKDYLNDFSQHICEGIVRALSESVPGPIVDKMRELVLGMENIGRAAPSINIVVKKQETDKEITIINNITVNNGCFDVRNESEGIINIDQRGTINGNNNNTANGNNNKLENNPISSWIDNNPPLEDEGSETYRERLITNCKDKISSQKLAKLLEKKGYKRDKRGKCFWVKN